MKTRFIRIMCTVMCISLLVGNFAYNAESVEAADLTFTSGQTTQDEYSVTYDSSKYSIYWVSRRTINCKNQYRSMWKNLDKGNNLGTATIRMYYLEPKLPLNGVYYAMSGCKINMDPTKVKGSVYGMSQLAEFGIATPNKDSRVCSPTVESLQIQATKDNFKNGNFSASTNVKYNFLEKKLEAGAGIEGGSDWGASSSYTYNMTNVILTQRNKDLAGSKSTSYACWSYDYRSKDGNPTWNSYLHSSSEVAGQVAYKTLLTPSDRNRYRNVPFSLYYDIRFGAGDKTNGQVANRAGASTNRDMCSISEKIDISY